MHASDLARIDAILAEKTVPEPSSTALRTADCDELADDWRLCLTLLWIAADDLTSFEALNDSMGGTLGIASGRIQNFVNGLGAGGYLAVDGEDNGWVYLFALTQRGRLAAEVLRAARRTN